MHGPVSHCPAHSSNPYAIRRHLCIRHPMDHFQIFGGTEFIECPHCGILLTTLTPQHHQSKFCLRQSARRLHIQSSERCRANSDTSTPCYIGEQPTHSKE